MDQAFPSDLTDEQWELIKDLVPKARAGGRPRTTCPRNLINAIFYLTRTGCAWRYLPFNFPPWQTVYRYFREWKANGIWREIHLRVVQIARRTFGKNEIPSTVIIDGQSVRAQYGEERGYDGFKKVRGRKRQILVDTLGLMWGSKVHSAQHAEQKRAFEVIENYPKKFPIPKRVLGDHSYSKPPFDVDLWQYWGIWPETRKGSKPLVKKPDGTKVRQVKISNLKPQRWIVERSFAWFNNYRRLNRDYERKTSNSEVFLFISQIQMILKRIEPG